MEFAEMHQMKHLILTVHSALFHGAQPIYA